MFEGLWLHGVGLFRGVQFTIISVVFVGLWKCGHRRHENGNSCKITFQPEICPCSKGRNLRWKSTQIRPAGVPNEKKSSQRYASCYGKSASSCIGRLWMWRRRVNIYHRTVTGVPQIWGTSL
eukprot:jgi/Botrbrau1/4963/Bobra.0122s0038.1